MSSPSDQTSFNPVEHSARTTLSILATHIPRVLQNRASTELWPAPTFFNSIPHMHKGLGLNFLRGTVAFGTQSWLKDMVQNKTHHLGHRLSTTVSIAAAGACGAAVATVFETLFLRKTILAGQPNNHYTLWRFTPTLTSMYFAREMGFILIILGKNDMTPIEQNMALFTGAWFTGMCHRMASLEAIKDTLKPSITIPDFRQGVFSTIANMAKGGVYSHPTFDVPFKNPARFSTMTINFLQVSCGLNMYLYRLMYLWSLRLINDELKKMEPVKMITSSIGFFSKPQTLKQEPDEPVKEFEKTSRP